MVCAGNDFTLRVLKLPPLPEGRAPDLDRLRLKLGDFFEQLAENIELPGGRNGLIPQRHHKGFNFHVIDINFGLNDQARCKFEADGLARLSCRVTGQSRLTPPPLNGYL